MSVKIAPSDILCELIEVLIHNILYARKVYPDTIFSRRRKYGIPVFQCIQPDVNNYINEALKASGGSVSEKYVFDVVDLKSIDESDPLLVNLEEYMRDFILRLHNTLIYLDNLVDDSTFCIRLQVTEYSNLEFNQNPKYEDFPWVKLNEMYDIPDSSEIVPVHSLNSNMFKLQIYIEKSS